VCHVHRITAFFGNATHPDLSIFGCQTDSKLIERPTDLIEDHLFLAIIPKSIIPLFVCSASLYVRPCLAAAPLFDYEESTLTVDALAQIPTEFASLFAFNTTGPVLGRGDCKVSPGDAAWPSEEEWEALNQLVGGALIKTTPIGAECYHDWEIYDAEKCKALVESWTVPYTQ
jgi:hypothetical protein